MEFGWSPEEAAFREELLAFAAEHLPPGWTTRIPGEEPYSEFTIDFCRKLGAKGWLAPHWPVEYGGGGDASPWRFTILSEELWAMGEPRGSQYMNTNWIGPAIIAAGTDEQKRRFLPPICAGEALWCQGFSEPGAGSDLGAMAMTAVRDGEAYVLNGEKIWTSYAGGSHHCFLLARTGEGTGDAGVSIFLVPMDAPGVSVERIPSMLDIHQVHHLRFADARVSTADRLGPEGGGWPIVRDALLNERVGAPRHIRAARVLDELVGAAKAAGRLEAADLQRAGEARGVCLAARALVHKVRQMGAGGRDPGPLAYLARAAVVDAERAVAEVAADIAGPGDLVSGAVTDGEFRTALIAGLGGGSYETQLNLVARLWLKLPKAA